MSARGVFVERDEQRNVVAVYCSRVCAEGCADRVEGATWPHNGKGITGYAVATISCEGCGQNVLDVCGSTPLRPYPVTVRTAGIKPGLASTLHDGSVVRTDDRGGLGHRPVTNPAPVCAWCRTPLPLTRGSTGMCSYCSLRELLREAVTGLLVVASVPGMWLVVVVGAAVLR